eukprot:tig00000944_g5975.t1
MAASRLLAVIVAVAALAHCVSALQQTIYPGSYISLPGTYGKCPCLYSYILNSGNENHKFAIYMVDTENYNAILNGKPFLYMAGYSTMPPGTHSTSIDFGPTTPGEGLHIVVQNLGQNYLTLTYNYRIVPAEVTTGVFASGAHLRVPFPHMGPAFFTFSFSFSDKRCYVGAFIMNQSGYDNFLSTGQPFITFARRFFYLGLDTTVKFQGYLPKHENVSLILQNVNQKARREVNVTITYNIVHQLAPVIESVSSVDPAGGVVTITGRNFGPAGTGLSPRVTVGGQTCSDATVSVANWELKCTVAAGTGGGHNVFVQIEGFDSGSSGDGKFSYIGFAAPSQPQQASTPPPPPTPPPAEKPATQQTSTEQQQQQQKSQEKPAVSADLKAIHSAAFESSRAPSTTYNVVETPGTEFFSYILDQMRSSPLFARKLHLFEDPIGFIDFHNPGERDEAVRLSEELQSELQALQFPSSCESQKSIVYSFSVRMGLGAHLNFLTVALRFAYERNWTVVTALPNDWLYWEGCRDGFHCLFERISSCNQFNTQPMEYWESMGPGSTGVDAEGTQLRHWVPTKYKHLGLRWFRAQLARFLFRPKPALLLKIDEMKRRVGWSGPVIGLHMRRRAEKVDQGEIEMLKTVVGPLYHPHVTKYGLLPPISAYMEAVRVIANRTGVYSVFVTSDADFQKELAAYEAEGFRFLYDRSEKRNRDFHEADIDAVATIGSLYLLGECNHWVGTFSSAYGRYGHDLMISKRLHSVALSIDIPWIAYP